MKTYQRSPTVVGLADCGIAEHINGFYAHVCVALVQFKDAWD